MEKTCGRRISLLISSRSLEGSKYGPFLASVIPHDSRILAPGKSNEETAIEQQEPRGYITCDYSVTHVLSKIIFVQKYLRTDGHTIAIPTCWNGGEKEERRHLLPIVNKALVDVLVEER